VRKLPSTSPTGKKRIATIGARSLRAGPAAHGHSGSVPVVASCSWLSKLGWS